MSAQTIRARGKPPGWKAYLQQLKGDGRLPGHERDQALVFFGEIERIPVDRDDLFASRRHMRAHRNARRFCCGAPERLPGGSLLHREAEHLELHHEPPHFLLVPERNSVNVRRNAVGDVVHDDGELTGRREHHGEFQASVDQGDRNLSDFFGWPLRRRYLSRFRLYERRSDRRNRLRRLSDSQIG